MKNLSKVLAVVLALVMALSMVSFAAYTDVADDANYAEAVSVLSSLDMLKGYEDGTFKPEGDITRAEFAMVVCRLIGSGAAAETPGATQFTDVAADHWASGAIALAAQNGIVNGYPDGTFKPDNNVLYEEAIKMVVAALGYTAVAETYGAYPTGYQIVAAQTGVLEGITDGKVGVAASRGVVAQLAYNALEVPMMTQTGFGTNVAYNYDNTLLLNRINVVKVEAAINGTAKSSDSYKADEIGLTVKRQFAATKENSEAGWYLTNASGIKPAINTAAWVTASKVKASADMVALADTLIDYEVEAYIANPTSRDAKLVAISMKDAGYSELVFATEDIDANNSALGAGELALYTDETKDDYVVYDFDFTTDEAGEINKVYLNGRENADLLANPALFLAADAEADVKLFDNDGDEVYEIAYVTTYVDFVVKSVTARNYRVVADVISNEIYADLDFVKDVAAGYKDADGNVLDASKNDKTYEWKNTLILDEEEDTYSFEIVKDGEAVDFTAIAVNDVLSVAGGFKIVNDKAELAYGTVVINTQTVSGTIDGLDTDNDIVYIDGAEYTYKSAIEGSLSMGDTADFYINARGIICGLDETSKVGNLKYGFVTVAMESNGLTADTLELRMMDAEGTWNTYVLADDFDVNGKTGNIGGVSDATNDDITDTANLVSGKYIFNQLVAYELNAEGEIKAIYTENVTDAFEIGTTPGSEEYNAATEMYNGKVVTDATVIFSVPTGTSNAAIIDEDVVTIASKASLVDRTGYIMTAYNVNDDLVAPVFLGYDITGNIDWTADFMVITKKTTRTNAEGKVGVELVGLVNGEEVTLFAATESNNIVATMDSNGTTISASGTANPSTLAKGDVILYSVDGAGEAAKIVKLQDADAMDTLIDGTFEPGTVKLGDNTVAGVKYTYYLGYVSEVKDNRVAIQGDRTVGSYAGRTNLRLNAESIVTEINTNHASGVKVTFGDTGSFVADSGLANNIADGDGDIVFIKAMNDVVIVEAVVYKAN